jgi:hypothetical protein
MAENFKTSEEQPIEPVEIINERPNNKEFEEPLNKVELNVKKVIQELHDNYHPVIYFLTTTSAVGAGYTIREIYRTAYPDERMPKMLFIDPSKAGELEKRGDNSLTINLSKETENKLLKYKEDKNIVNGNIALIDEWGSSGRGTSLSTAKVAIDMAMQKLGFMGKIVSGGFRDDDRSFYAYLIRERRRIDAEENNGQDDFYRIDLATNRPVKPPWNKSGVAITERERADKNVKRLKELGIKIGEMIKKEEGEK